MEDSSSDYYLNHAVNKAFKDNVADNYFASYFINITIDPQLMDDINIHPTKTEIKFEDEKAIYARSTRSSSKKISRPIQYCT